MFGDEGVSDDRLFDQILLCLAQNYRWSFNITLLITGVFALAAGGSADYIALSSLVAVWSVGVGGNLPVDSAVFLGTLVESSPRHSHNLQV